MNPLKVRVKLSSSYRGYQSRHEGTVGQGWKWSRPIATFMTHIQPLLVINTQRKKITWWTSWTKYGHLLLSPSNSTSVEIAEVLKAGLTLPCIAILTQSKWKLCQRDNCCTYCSSATHLVLLYPALKVCVEESFIDSGLIGNLFFSLWIQINIQIHAVYISMHLLVHCTDDTIDSLWIFYLFSCCLARNKIGLS